MSIWYNKVRSMGRMQRLHKHKGWHWKVKHINNPNWNFAEYIVFGFECSKPYDNLLHSQQKHIWAEMSLEVHK
jgi:hypothetical protein